MKKLLFLLLIAIPVRGQNTTAVTATLLNPAQVAQIKDAFVRFELRNYGQYVPVVTGFNVILPSTIDVYPDATGSISTNLFSNDKIYPANTYYSVCYYKNGVKFYCCNVIITGTTFNMDSAGCLNATSIPPPAVSPCITCPTGPQGPAGPTGPAGPAGLSYISRTIVNDNLRGTIVNTPAVLPNNNLGGVHGGVAYATTYDASLSSDIFVGITVSGAGTTGSSVNVALGGPVNCVFDTGTTSGHYVGQSLTHDATCSDLGAPDSTNEPATTGTGRLVFGYALETHVGAGTYPIYVTPMAPSYHGFDTSPVLPFLLGSPHGAFFGGSNLMMDANSGAVALTNLTPLRWYNGYDGTTRQGSLEIVSTGGLSPTLGFLQNQLYLSRALNGAVSQTFSGAGVMTVDFGAGSKINKILNGNVTYVAASNAFDMTTAGPIFPLRICQDGTGGRTFKWNLDGSELFIDPPAVPAFANGCVNMWWYNHGTTGGGALTKAGPSTPIHPPSILGRSTAIGATTISRPMEDHLLRFNGNLTCTTTSAVLTAVNVFGAITRYTYASYTGAEPSVGQTLVVTGFVTGGNNGTFVTTNVSGGASGYFDVTTTTQVSESHAAAADSLSPVASTATLTLSWTDRAGNAKSLSTAAVDCSSSGNMADLIHIIRPLKNSNVQYAVTIANNPTYDLDVSMETIQ